MHINPSDGSQPRLSSRAQRKATATISVARGDAAASGALLGTPTRRDLLHLPLIAALGSRPSAKAATTRYLIYWGTYTAGGPRYGTGDSKGIYVSNFDAVTGRVSPPQLAAETPNPSYLAIHPNGRLLYSVNEHIDADGKTPGEVSAFSIDRGSGKLTQLSRVSSRGGMPCHIAVHQSGKVVAVANWATGSTAAFPIARDGRLGEGTGFYQHAGTRSPEGAPPAAVHCHAVVYSPDNRFLIATDTGLNKIFVHRLDPNRATFQPHDPPYLGLRNPANPRHLVFHPSAKWAYVANEANPNCTMLRWDAGRAVFEEGAITRTVPPDFTGRTSPAEAVMHPSGKYVLVSNRGHDSIAVLRIDERDGSLTLVEAMQPGGAGPRSFNVDPTGQWVFALMQRSNTIVPLRMDIATGKLTRASEPVPLPVPVCAKFVAL
jgi:6-phosphogluconolactonase